MTEMLCTDCDQVVAFETPACDDGQDAGDLMCVVCGCAVTLGGLLLDDRTRPLLIQGDRRDRGDQVGSAA